MTDEQRGRRKKVSYSLAIVVVLSTIIIFAGLAATAAVVLDYFASIRQGIEAIQVDNQEIKATVSGVVVEVREIKNGLTEKALVADFSRHQKVASELVAIEGHLLGIERLIVRSSVTKEEEEAIGVEVEALRARVIQTKCLVLNATFDPISLSCTGAEMVSWAQREPEVDAVEEPRRGVMAFVWENRKWLFSGIGVSSFVLLFTLVSILLRVWRRRSSSP